MTVAYVHYVFKWIAVCSAVSYLTLFIQFFAGVSQHCTNFARFRLTSIFPVVTKCVLQKHPQVQCLLPHSHVRNLTQHS